MLYAFCNPALSFYSQSCLWFCLGKRPLLMALVSTSFEVYCSPIMPKLVVMILFYTLIRGAIWLMGCLPSSLWWISATVPFLHGMIGRFFFIITKPFTSSFAWMESLLAFILSLTWQRHRSPCFLEWSNGNIYTDYLPSQLLSNHISRCAVVKRYLVYSPPYHWVGQVRGDPFLTLWNG